MAPSLRKFNQKRRHGDSVARRLAGAAAALTIVAALGACQERIDTRGHVPMAEDMERIKPGLQGREEVREILGSPSTVSNFTDDKWYYVSKKTKKVAFFEPEVLEQNVVVVEFDDTGIVKDLQRYALEDGLIIDPVTRKTPAPGRELSFIEQLIGNLGRFNSQPKGPAGL